MRIALPLTGQQNTTHTFIIEQEPSVSRHSACPAQTLPLSNVMFRFAWSGGKRPVIMPAFHRRHAHMKTSIEMLTATVLDPMICGAHGV